MSSSGSCTEDESFDTTRLQSILATLYDDLTESVNKVRLLRKKVRTSVPLNHERDLTKEAAKIFKRKRGTIKDLVDFWLPLWKDENRITKNGRIVRLGEEAPLLGLEPEREVDIYDLYNLLDGLFID